MVVGLSALLTGRLYPQEIFLVLISVKRLSRPQDYSAAGRITSPSRIEPATFRLLAHCPSLLRHYVPRQLITKEEEIKIQYYEYL